MDQGSKRSSSLYVEHTGAHSSVQAYFMLLFLSALS